MASPPGVEHPVRLGDERAGSDGVLQHAVAVDDVERGVGKRQRLAVGDAQIAAEAEQREVPSAPGRWPSVTDRCRSHARRRAANRARSVPMPQPTSSSRWPAIAAEVDQLGQVAQLVEAVVVEIGEELAAAHGMRGHLEVVDALVPVTADLLSGHSPPIGTMLAG